MASKVKPLNDELKARFYPMVESRGFTRRKSAGPHFAEFRRASLSGEECFEVQWDKYWRPYFVINFGRTAVDEKIWTQSGRLQRRRGGMTSCWFGLAPSILERALKLRWRYSPREVVDEVIVAFDEVECWWKDGKIDPHIYMH